jgi:hypothetical protein
VNRYVMDDLCYGDVLCALAGYERLIRRTRVESSSGYHLVEQALPKTREISQSFACSSDVLYLNTFNYESDNGASGG